MASAGLVGTTLGLAPSLLFEIVFLIFGGCCSNVVVLEELTRVRPHSATLITLSQHLFVAFVSLFSQLRVVQLPKKGGRRIRFKPPKVPLYHWGFMVILFFFSSQLNNMALGFNISMPLHIIFRSGAVVVSMVLGFLILKKRYSAAEVVGVFMIAAGMIISTLAGSSNFSNGHNESLELLLGIPAFAFGVLFLSLATVISAALGIYQQYTYHKYGKFWEEGLFYTHALGLPLFLLFSTDIKQQMVEIGTDSSYWAWIALNAFSQYICVSGVHRLSAVTSALALNIILTIRKFLSLAISVYIFGNVWTGIHTVGALFVLLGTVLFSIGTRKRSIKVKKS